MEAQGGVGRAKYGDGLIKEWSKDFTLKYENGYDRTNLIRFRAFYIEFPKGGSLSHQLTWTHYRYIISIKDENERNYYINLCLNNYLSVRELRNEIKNNSYNRLLEKPKRVELINFNTEINIKSDIKNPIILRLNKNETINNEKELQLKILSQLQSFFLQLGNGFALIGNEFKIINDEKLYFIDILLFNYEFNCFVVVELKFRELKQLDKGKIEFYMKLVDKHIKKPFHSNTIGIIISKEQDDFTLTYVGCENIFPIKYKLFN